MPIVNIMSSAVLKTGFRLSLLILFLVLQGNAAAETLQKNPQLPDSNHLRENYSYRFETELTYEHLTPHSVYGDWVNVDVALYAKVHRRVTAFGRLGHHSREIEGEGQMVVAGAYVDWLPWLSTYSAVADGYGENYLPEWRIDQDVNFKISPFVLTLGASYIDYEGPQRDRILSIGATWYHKRWVTEFRMFRNISDPGSVDSDTHLVSVGYGQDGWRWIYLKLSIGAQAYQSATLAEPEDVRMDATEVSLYHRHWIGGDWGLMERVGFLSLDSGYDKYSVAIGLFKEF